MIAVPGGMKVHMAVGYTDLRKGLDGLAMLVQQVLKGDPFCGHLFAFRGRRAQRTTFHIQRLSSRPAATRSNGSN